MRILKGNRGSGELIYCVTTGISAKKCRRWSVPFDNDIANVWEISSIKLPGTERACKLLNTLEKDYILVE